MEIADGHIAQLLCIYVNPVFEKPPASMLDIYKYCSKYSQIHPVRIPKRFPSAIYKKIIGARLRPHDNCIATSIKHFMNKIFAVPISCVCCCDDGIGCSIVSLDVHQQQQQQAEQDTCTSHQAKRRL